MSSPRGFTLIEVMVVVIIMGILSTLVLPAVMGRTGEARQSAATSQIAMISLALDMYRADNGRYPTTDQGLQSLVEKPSAEPVAGNWRGSYLKNAILPSDPWGSEYLYLSPGMSGRPYDIISRGADGVEGGEGEDADVFSWKNK